MPYRFLGLVIFLALAVRVALLLIGFSAGGEKFFLHYSDATNYDFLARNLLAGNGFSADAAPPFRPYVFKTPGYPAVLAALFAIGGPGVALGVQILLGALIPVLGYILLQHLRFSESIARGTALFLAIEPFLAAHSVFFLTEVLFIFLLLLASILTVRWVHGENPLLLYGAAVLLAAAAFVRPIGFYLLFLLFLCAVAVILRRRAGVRKAVTHAGVALLLGILVLSPWLARNWQLFGAPRLASIENTNLYFLLGGSVRAMAHGTTLDEERRVMLSALRAEGIDPSNLANAGLLKRRTLEIIAEYPLAALKSNALTGWQFFTHDAYYDLAVHLGFYKERTGPPLTILKLRESLAAIPRVVADDPMFFVFISGRAFWMLFFFLFLFGFVWSLRKGDHRFRDISIGLLIAYFLVASLSTGYAINARLRLPIALFYAAYALMPLGALWNQLVRRRALHDI